VVLVHAGDDDFAIAEQAKARSPARIFGIIWVPCSSSMWSVSFTADRINAG
jgi:hypothetical protein